MSGSQRLLHSPNPRLHFVYARLTRAWTWSPSSFCRGSLAMQRDEESAIFTRYKAFGIRGGKFFDWSAPHPHPHSLLTFVFSRSCCGVSKTTEEGDKNSEREPRVYWLRIWTATWILLNLGGRTLSMHSSSWLEPKGDSHTKSVASGQPRYPVIVYRTGPVSHFLPLLHLCGFRAGILCHSYSRIRLSTQLLVVSFSVCRFFGVSHYWGRSSLLKLPDKLPIISHSVLMYIPTSAAP